MNFFPKIVLCIFSAISTHCLIEEGFKTYGSNHIIKTGGEMMFMKSMYEGSVIMFKIHCKTLKDDEDRYFDLALTLLSQKCEKSEKFDKATAHWFKHKCTKEILLEKKLLNKVHAVDLQKLQEKAHQGAHTTASTITENTSQSADNVSTPAKKKRKRREASPIEQATTKNKTHVMPHGKTGENKLPPTKYKASYTLHLTFRGEDMQFTGYIESKHEGSFLSAMNWPLLPFYGAMSLLYLAFAIGWFVASCCNWRDLLRLQFWIGSVIALGMFENALFFTEYQSISHHGKENGLLYFAEIVSCIKKALARILVVIVSMGFGIVKPRLGQTLHKVLAVGGLYFILASIEGCIKIKDNEKVIINSKTHTYALVPLILLDVTLCWWIFTSLVQTTRTLRIRKNVIKLTLYRHFTNTLIFAVLASLGYMIWMIKEAKFSDCIDITGLWLNDAIWPFLFAIILAVIMVLWRPSQNSQRYAFTPLDLGDSDEDENDDMTLSEAFDGMKMRNKSESHVNGSTTKNRMKAEDDLKWVEENIPSVPSTLLPTIDSDEEIVMTKFETSKMD